MSSSPGISVVIPNFNGEALLPQVLPAVYTALNNTGLANEIIVVDDCSNDLSLQVLKEQFPEVKILQNDYNRGFSVTANYGIRESMFDWVLLLNSDVKLESDYFKSLLQYTTRQDVLGVMGRIIGWDDDVIQDGAKYPFFHGVKIKTSGNYLMKNKDDMKPGIYSMYLSGANAFLNKKIFMAIGGFNEIFSPFYVEDFELCLRAWRLGYICLFDYHAVCRHKTSATIKNGSKKKRINKIYNRNKLYLHGIHLNRGRRLLWFFQVIGESLFHFILLKWSYLSALFQFMNSYKKVINSRIRMHNIAEGKDLLTVNQVANKILNEIKGKEILRF